jgi:hypothetical protein
MTSPTVAPAYTARNERPHSVIPLRRALPAVAADVDHLLELRGLIKRAQAEERRVTSELVAHLTTRGLAAIQGTHAVAMVDVRTTLQIDPALFLEAAGARAPEALTVSVTAARRILGQADLEAIAETVTTPVLRVEALREPAA